MATAIPAKCFSRRALFQIFGSSPEAPLHSPGILRVARDELERSELEATQCNTKHTFESA